MVKKQTCLTKKLSGSPPRTLYVNMLSELVKLCNHEKGRGSEVRLCNHEKECGSEGLKTEEDVDLKCWKQKRMWIKKCYQPCTDKSSYFMNSQTSY